MLEILSSAIKDTKHRNCATGVRDTKVILLIFPKKTSNARKVLRKMDYPFTILSHHEHRKTQRMYKEIVRELLALLKRWEDFLPFRSLIEDLFKSGKEAFFPEGDTPIFTPLC